MIGAKGGDAMSQLPDMPARLNRALDYIESNLTGEIDLEELGRLACTSSFNFQRMFTFVADVTLAEYIRRRRLTQAAMDLQGTRDRVLDIALRYGYDSPVSFARAFSTLHGMTPKMARESGVTLKAYPRISFQISIKGEKSMDYRIEKKESFEIFGIEGVFISDESRQGDHTPKMLWENAQADGRYDRLAEDAGPLPAFVPQSLCKVHGFCSYRDTGEGTFPYLLGSFRGQESRTAGYTVVTVPSHTWAIFPSGPYAWADFDNVIETLYKRFFSEWLPASEYEQAGGLDFELYGGDGDRGYIELWFAIKKR